MVGEEREKPGCFLRAESLNRAIALRHSQAAEHLDTPWVEQHSNYRGRASVTVIIRLPASRLLRNGAACALPGWREIELLYPFDLVGELRIVLFQPGNVILQARDERAASKRCKRWTVDFEHLGEFQADAVR